MDWLQGSVLSARSDSNGAEVETEGSHLSQEINSKALATVPQQALDFAGRLARQARHGSHDNVALMALEPQSYSQRGYITAKELRSSKQRLLDIVERERSESAAERVSKE